MIKISLLLISIFSLLYGLVFFFAPYFFAELTLAEPTNIAWLRNIGASINVILESDTDDYFEVYMNSDDSSPTVRSSSIAESYFYGYKIIGA